MKKIFAALLVASLTLTMFSACGDKKSTESTTETTASGSGVIENRLEFTSNSGSKEFTDADGKVVFKVEYEVPWLDDSYSEEAKIQFNNYIQATFLDDAFTHAEENVKNVRPDETEPRKIKISYEPLYRMDNILSVVISTSYSSNSDNAIDFYRTFNLNNGEVLAAEAFFTNDINETKEGIFEIFLPEAIGLISEDSEMSSKERETLAAEKLKSNFESSSFYITDSYIAFVYNVSDFQEGMGMGAGTHEFVIDLTTYSYLGITNTL